MAEAEPGVLRLDDRYCARLLPQRDPLGHKGTFGTVVCVAGSLEYAGAALITATAAARGGAGLVVLAVPMWLVPLLVGRVPEIVMLPLPESATEPDLDAPEAIEILDRAAADAFVVGPGLFETEGYRRFLLRLLAERGSPVVLDGGGLNLLARSPNWPAGVARSCVLTPHPGEIARLTGSLVRSSDDSRLERCTQAAHDFRQVVVLKGARTVIASPDGRAAVAPFANPALATAGSGDVLAGLIGALLAQKLAPFDAACLGVYLHGQAGERVSARLGDAGLMATDLPYEVARARHELTTKHDD